jgi:hypothetical protein
MVAPPQTEGIVRAEDLREMSRRLEEIIFISERGLTERALSSS